MGEAKKKNQRQCPALGRLISAEECGQGRNSKIACPVDCPFNPLAPANYLAMYRPIEDRALKALQPLLNAELTPGEKRELANLVAEADGFAADSFAMWLLHGTGRVARWEQEGRFRSWRNDDQMLLKHFAKTRPALLEGRGRIDDCSCRVRDLLRLEDGETVLTDNSLTEKIARFRAYLTWVHDAPAGLRIVGMAIDVPAVPPRGPRQVLDCLLDHLGAPTEGRLDWLMEHMALVSDSIGTLRQGRLWASTQGVDCTGHVTSYRIIDSPRAVLRALAAAPDFVDAEVEEEDGAVFFLLEAGHDRGARHGVPTLAKVVCWGDEVALSSIGKERHAAAKQILESVLGPLVVFSAENSQVIEEVELLRAPDPEMVPPCLLENPGSVHLAPRWVPSAKGDPERVRAAEFLAVFEESVDQPLPELGGLTPRTAATDPAARPALIEWMKAQLTLCDDQRLDGVDVDLDHWVDELGLAELALPPALLGEFVEDDLEDVLDDEDRDDEEEGADDWEWDPCPQVALTAGQVQQRAAAVGHRAINLTDEQWGDLVDLIDFLSIENMPEVVFNLTLAAATTAAMILHPHRAMDIEPEWDRAERMIDHLIELLNDVIEEDPEAIRQRAFALAAESPQPNVAELALTMFYRGASAIPPADAGPPENLGIGALILLTLIWELGHWPPAPLR